MNRDFSISGRERNLCHAYEAYWQLDMDWEFSFACCSLLGRVGLILVMHLMGYQLPRS